MVESSVGISAPLLIGEESILDPLVGVVTGTIYSGMKIFDKIRHKNKDDYSIDVLVDEEQKQPIDTTLENWRNIRSRDAGHSQWSHQQPVQMEDEEEPIAENFSWEDVIQPAQEPSLVIQNNEQNDHLDRVVVDVQLPNPEPQPIQTPDEMLVYPRDLDRPRREDREPNNGGGGDGDEPDPNDGQQQQEEEEKKEERNSVFNSPIFRDAMNQIANRISGLQKDQEDAKNEQHDSESEQSKQDFEKERAKYMADIEFQLRSQQSLIDLLNKYKDGEIETHQIHQELDQLQTLIQQQQIERFTEDFVYSDVVESF